MNLIIYKINTFLVIVIILTGCGSMPGPGEMEPVEAVKMCMKKSNYSCPPSEIMHTNEIQIKPLYGPEGHFYTTLAVGSLAGYSACRFLPLAYYSQYPDSDHFYDAAWVGIGQLPFFWTWGQRNEITGVLHSLHGGNHQDINSRRESIRNALKNNIETKKWNEIYELDWLNGLLIHAYGDSYAHTINEYNSDKEEAFGPWIGHSLQSIFGENPDDIISPIARKKYYAYVEQLHRTIQVHENNNFKFLIKEIEDLFNNPKFKQSDFKRDFHKITLTTAHSTKAESIEDSNSLEKLALDLENFSKCVSENSRRLTNKEVKRAIDLIKNSN